MSTTSLDAQLASGGGGGRQGTHLLPAFKISKHSLGIYIGFGSSVVSLILLLLARPITIPQSVVILALPTVSAFILFFFFFFLTPSVGPSETTPAYTISINNKDTPVLRFAKYQSKETRARKNVLKRPVSAAPGDARESTAASPPTADQMALCLQPGRREHQRERATDRSPTEEAGGNSQYPSFVCCQLQSRV